MARARPTPQAFQGDNDVSDGGADSDAQVGLMLGRVRATREARVDVSLACLQIPNPPEGITAPFDFECSVDVQEMPLEYLLILWESIHLEHRSRARSTYWPHRNMESERERQGVVLLRRVALCLAVSLTRDCERVFSASARQRLPAHTGIRTVTTGLLSFFGTWPTRAYINFGIFATRESQRVGSPFVLRLFGTTVRQNAAIWNGEGGSSRAPTDPD